MSVQRIIAIDQEHTVPTRSAASEAVARIQQSEPTPATTVPIPWWVAAIVILGAVLVAAGGLFALVRPETLLEAGDHMNAAANVYAGYLVSRNLALSGMLLAMLVLRARRMLSGLMVLTALVQVTDAVVDATTGRVSLLPIILVFAAAFLIGARRLAGQGFWKAASWQDGPVRR